MFKDAVNASNSTRKATTGLTANGAVTFTTTYNKLLDLFAIIGSVRNKTGAEYIPVFDLAYAEDPRLALQTVLWVRDAREGAGERKTAYTLFKHIETVYPEAVDRLIPVLAEFGRFDDLFQFETPRAMDLAVKTIAQAIREGNGLAAKWAPREYKFKRTAKKVGDKVVRTKHVDKTTVANKSRARNNKIAEMIATELGLSMKEYRKHLSAMSSTVEQLMCAQDWSEVDYNKLPTHAAKQYVEAFKRHDETRYLRYLDALSTGEAKVNASTVMPHEVVKLLAGNDNSKVKLANAMWDAMPVLMGDNGILPMIDTSGSMSVAVGGSPNLRCVDVAVALGLYVASKQKGAFNNMWLNFDGTPKLRTLNGDKLSVIHSDLMRHSHDWGYNTNLQAAFDLILSTAKRYHVKQEDMPKALLIMSDMEFDEAARGQTNFEALRKKYKLSGYEMPNVIFWNLRARNDNMPVRAGTNGTALVSGFNPNVLKAVLSGEKYDPVKVMLDTIDAERYRVLGM